jgi:putative aldouronate transport system substrate-binding protein
MNKAKKLGFAAVILLLLVNFSAFGGGGSQRSGGGALVVPDQLPVLSPANPVTFTIYSESNFPELSENNRFLRMLKDELGVTLQIDNSGGMNTAEKIGIMITSGDLPDFMYCAGGSSRFIQTGNVMTLDEWLSIAPNIAAHVEGYRKMMSHPDDGKLYVLPNYNRFYGEVVLGDYDSAAFFIQKAVLEEFNFPEIKTLDDYFNLIRRYKARYPTIDGAPTIGFSVSGAANFLPHIMNPPLHLMGQANNGDYAWIPDPNNPRGGHAELFSHGQSAHDYFKTLNGVYNEGLMDPETFTQSVDQYVAKIATGRVLGVFDEHWFLSATGAIPALRQAGMHNRTYVGTTPTWAGVQPYYRDRPVMNLEQGYGINPNSPRRAQAVALINTLLEEKWQKRMTWGVEGEDYQVNANGRFSRTAEQRAKREDAVWRASNLAEIFWDALPKHQGTYTDGNAFTPANQPEEWQQSLSQYDRDFLRKAGKQTWVDFMNDPPQNPVWYPLWTIAVPDGSDAQQAHTEYLEALFQYYAQAVAARPAEFETVWQDFQRRVAQIDNKATTDYITEQALIRINTWQE